MARNEAKLWQEVKKNIKGISFTRIENSASFGTPDLLCYNKNNTFFTIELKVINSDNHKVKFSPHQISFHVRHPINSFIMVKTLDPLAVKLYEGKQILSLVSRSENLEPVSLGFVDISLCLKKL